MVFPTQVGVIPFVDVDKWFNGSIPHASGGDPDSEKAMYSYFKYSPRKWG